VFFGNRFLALFFLVVSWEAQLGIAQEYLTLSDIRKFSSVGENFSEKSCELELTLFQATARKNLCTNFVNI